MKVEGNIGAVYFVAFAVRTGEFLFNLLVWPSDFLFAFLADQLFMFFKEILHLMFLYLDFDDIVSLSGDILFHFLNPDNADFIHEIHFPELIIVVDSMVVILALVGHADVVLAFVVFFLFFEFGDSFDDEGFDFGDSVVELGLFLVGGVTLAVGTHKNTNYW